MPPEVSQSGTELAAATLISKTMVDVARGSPFPTPAWALPVLAMAISVVLLIVLAWLARGYLNGELVVNGFVSGVTAGAGAAGVTQIQKRMREGDSDQEVPQESPGNADTGFKGIGAVR